MHGRKLIHVEPLMEAAVTARARPGHQRRVCHETPVHTQRNTKLGAGPVESNHIKGLAARVSF